MREIKFRYFVPENNYMLYIDITDQLNTEYNHRMFQEYEIMQYTWLKDANWKEIYEGDIVCVEFSNWNFDKWIIEYQTWTYWINYVTNSSEELRLEYEYIEIIGNTHENPELLTN